MQPVRSECKEMAWSAFRGSVLSSVGVSISLIYMKMLDVLGRECAGGTISPVSFPNVTCKDVSSALQLYNWVAPIGGVVLPLAAGAWSASLTDEAEMELKHYYKKFCISVGALGALPIVANFACSFFATPLIFTFTRECIKEVVVPVTMPSMTCNALDTGVQAFWVAWPILNAVSPPIASIWSRLYNRL